MVSHRPTSGSSPTSSSHYNTSENERSRTDRTSEACPFDATSSEDESRAPLAPRRIRSLPRSHANSTYYSPSTRSSSQPETLQSSRSAYATAYSPYGDDRNERVAQLAASLENNSQSELAELGDYFLGLKTAEQAGGCTTPTAMRLYYQQPADGSLPSRLPLFLVYQSSDGQLFHFPVMRNDTTGRWRVKYGESSRQTYPSLVSLMRHHLNYLFASPYQPATFDSFEVWKAYTRI